VIGIVLVHMACAGAWAWGDVPDRLRKAGHEVAAPDLDLSPGQTPDTHADAVAAAAPASGPLYLVGHSYGGMVVPALAERLGDRVAGAMVIDGLVPDPGDSAFALRPRHAAARRAAAEARGDGLFPPDRPGPGDPDWMLRLVPMPVSAFEAPVSFTPLPPIPTFVHCTRSEMGDQAERARARNWAVIPVDSGHALPFERGALCGHLVLAAAAVIER
jgi:pimeloyl-ACP methyl ester carboxylesterase